MTTTPVAPVVPVRPAASSPGPTSSRWLPWLSLPATAAMAYLLCRGEDAVASGVADLDPLYGLAYLFIIAVAGVMALVSLVLAVVFMFTSPETRAAGTLAGALWTATVGFCFTVWYGVGDTSDSVYLTSTTYGDQVGWQVAAGAVTLVPLVVVALVAALGRRRG